MLKFGRSYQTKEEITLRFKNFVATHDMVSENNDKNPHVKMEINKFADLSP